MLIFLKIDLPKMLFRLKKLGPKKLDSKEDSKCASKYVIGYRKVIPDAMMKSTMEEVAKCIL